jgi:hypothetical protein
MQQMTPNKRADIRYTATNMHVKADYDAGFVEALTNRVPHGSRRWYKKDGEWVIDIRKRELVMEIIRSFFKTVGETNLPHGEPVAGSCIALVLTDKQTAAAETKPDVAEK